MRVEQRNLKLRQDMNQSLLSRANITFKSSFYYIKSSIQCILLFMSLAFEQKSPQTINKTMNRIDKLRDSIKLSKRKIQTGQKLTNKQKQIILRYITQDYAFNLAQYLQKRAIKFDSQVGMECCGWNLLHLAVKQFILKQQFHQYPDQYQKFINLKTVEGYTAAMIAIINQSNQSLELLLKYGPVDIHQTDNKRMTPYQLAINYKNQKAIRILMNYENQLHRHNKVVSKTLLQEPIVFIKRQQGCCYRSFIALFQCLSLGFYSHIPHQQLKSSNSSPRKSSILNIGTDFFVSNNLEQVKISHQPSQQNQYVIQWKSISLIITNLRYPLFQNYNPFDITQKNIVIKNNLILFQCLSQNPSIVRKIVQIDRSKPNHFTINLYINYQLKKFTINNLIPFLKDRQQPMFIQNHNQMWPMLLQKGLAKAHGSYFDLDNVQPLLLIEQMTGFPTFQIDIQDCEHTQIFYLLKKIHSKGYLYLLQGTQGSNLSSQSSQNNQNSQLKDSQIKKKDCFSVLQYFDKNQKKLILVNCPFVDQAWKQKQKYQMHSLKLIKSHFNNHDQMCVWIEFDRIKDYFSKIIVSTTLSNYQRRNFKVKTKNQLFFTFKAEKKREEKVIIQLINLDTKKPVKFGQIRAFRNEQSNKVNFDIGIQGETFTQGVLSTQNEAGQYMCCIEIDKAIQHSQFEQQNIAQSLIHSKVDQKIQNYTLIMWSVDGLQPRLLDQTLGPIQFLHFVKTNSLSNWTQSQVYRVQIVCDYALIIMNDKNNQSKMMNLTIESIQKNDLIQGEYKNQDTIQMLKQQIEDMQKNKQSTKKQFFYYCILRNAKKYNLTGKSSYIKNSNDLNPAGQSSIGKKLNFFSE